MKIYRISGKHPYKIRVSVHGEDRTPEKLKNVSLYAFSARQARYLFLHKYSFLNDYLSMGYDVEVVPNDEIIQNVREYKQRRSEEVEE